MFGTSAHRVIFLVALFGLAIGLPLNKIVLSLSGLLLALNWLLEARFSEKWALFKTNQLAWLLAAVFFVHVLGLLWTTDFSYAANDIRIKLPLLLLAIVLPSSKPLSMRWTRYLLMAFLTSVLVASFINYGYFVHDGLDDDMELRNMSLFTSHVRMSLMVTFSFVISVYFGIKRGQFWQKMLFFMGASWLFYYAIFSQVLSGLLALFIVVLCSLFWVVAKIRLQKWRYSLFGLLSLVIVASLTWLYFSFQPPEKQLLDKSSLVYETPSGNTYTHYLESDLTENGYYVYYYLCEDELEQEWPKRSSIPADGLDAKGNPVMGTLIRYMTSKGLRKDAHDFDQLTDKDVFYIEQGIASVVYTEKGLKPRIAAVSFELQKYVEGGDPNGSTILERLEYWNTGLKIAKENWLFGVGTGDVQHAFDEMFERQDSRLLPENRVRAHQQLLTIWITFGLIGLLIFIIYHIRFLTFQWQMGNYLAFVFGLIIMTSYLTEDTLETQVGVTFMAFFMALFSTTNTTKHETN